MKVSKFYLQLVSILFFISIIFYFLPDDKLFTIYFYSFLIHSLVLVYITSSFLEINVFHEKQGSKLDLSKSKLSSDRSWFFISKTRSLYTNFLHISISVLIIIIFNLIFFYPLFKTQTFTYNIFEKEYTIETWLWNNLKIFYIFTVSLSWCTILYNLFKKFPLENSDISTQVNTIDNKKQFANELSLFVGINEENNEQIIIPERGLYQNVLITGTIGTGKTSSAMYPFVEQLISQNIGMLILDVKGNFHLKVKELAKKYNRKVTVIELNGTETYNPLDKPNLKPSIIANRLRTILSLFSNTNATDTYWLDKVELYLTECIKLCRIYNDGYVTFVELHKLIYNKKYLSEKIEFVKDLFLSNKLNYSQVYELSTCLDFFQSEFQTLDSKVLSIIQSEISRITQIFINDLDVKRTFCPNKENVTFSGFENLKNNIVVLNMNVSEYRNLSKIIAAYLKLDFQSEVLMRLAKKTNISPVAFVCDEYSEYVTENDANFFSESREAKCINIVSTQSYTSLLNAVKEQAAAKVIIQSLVNKIWFRTDDLFTIEEAQKQLGKEDKVKFSRSLSENAKETKYNYILKTFKSENSNISESISTHIEHDFVYDINAFSMKLKTFEAICFITTGHEILNPCVVKLLPAHQKHFI